MKANKVTRAARSFAQMVLEEARCMDEEIRNASTELENHFKKEERREPSYQ